jgi:hypothetical protein
MNKLDYYTRRTEKYDEKEETDIKDEYSSGLNIIQIADLHRRTPGQIAYNLKKNGITVSHVKCNGYVEYITGDLYNEIVESGGNTRKKKVLKEENENTKVDLPKEKKKQSKDKLLIAELQNEIIDLKSLVINQPQYNVDKDISEIKKELKNISKLIHDIFEFKN